MTFNIFRSPGSASSDRLKWEWIQMLINLSSKVIGGMLPPNYNIKTSEISTLVLGKPGVLFVESVILFLLWEIWKEK